MGADKTGLGGEPIEVDTSNILFIGGGAFDGLQKAIEHQRGKVLNGFRPNETAAQVAASLQVLPEHLHKFGFLPEFVGRFPVLVQLDALTEQELVDIMTRPRDALMRQYQRLFAMEGARLEATPDGLRALARQAMTRNTGARGLRAVLEELLLETMFDLPSHLGSDRYVIDESAVVEGRPRPMPERTAA
jgi:ATP-dependent Clp protease ATP-binding subunit ClpX